MRYMWDRYDDYFGPGRASLPVRAAARVLRPRLQRWDRETSTPERVDRLVANSRYIAGQIRAAYGRDASRVIHPFVDTSRFGKPREPSRNYLMVGAFAPNKRVDLAVEAFNRLRLPLLIVGSGQDELRLKRLAGPTIDFLGSLSDSAIADLYARCKAFVFPGKEDFGITPLEAMAAGAPVIAFGEGGVAETVTEGTGVLFAEQSVEGLSAAIASFEAGQPTVDEARCRARAGEFTRAKFQAELSAELTTAWAAAGRDPAELAAVLEHPG
jgi:glycosyltransferase involved in cell wall biosynthesis